MQQPSTRRRPDRKATFCRAYALVPGTDSRGRCAMPLMYIVGLLIVVGVLLWLINTYIPMDPKILGILNAVVVIAVVIYLLQVFGLLSTIENIKVGHTT